MKFLMVMIICFAEDTCQAVFDATQFDTYDQCIFTRVGWYCRIGCRRDPVLSGNDGDVEMGNRNR